MEGLRPGPGHHWKLFFYITLFMAGMQLTTHGTQDMYSTFLERYRHYGPDIRAWITAISMGAAIIGDISLVSYPIVGDAGA